MLRPDTSLIPQNKCCICGHSRGLAVRDPLGYPFCGAHNHRAYLLSWGRSHHWPAIRTSREINNYALDQDMQAWLLTALFGTDERVFALIEASEEYDERLEKLA